MAHRRFPAPTAIDSRHPSRVATFRTLRVLLAGAVLAGSLSFAPASALASRLSTDRISRDPALGRPGVRIRVAGHLCAIRRAGRLGRPHAVDAQDHGA